MEISCRQKKTFGALLTDLSKAIDYLLHGLSNDKKCIWVQFQSINVQEYLSKRKQRTEVNSAFSSWERILFGIPKGSLLGPLLFNIFLCDLFFIMNDTDFLRHANNNIPHATSKNSLHCSLTIKWQLTLANVILFAVLIEMLT